MKRGKQIKQQIKVVAPQAIDVIIGMNTPIELLTKYKGITRELNDHLSDMFRNKKVNIEILAEYSAHMHINILIFSKLLEKDEFEEKYLTYLEYILQNAIECTYTKEKKDI